MIILRFIESSQQNQGYFEIITKSLSVLEGFLLIKTNFQEMINKKNAEKGQSGFTLCPQRYQILENYKRTVPRFPLE